MLTGLTWADYVRERGLVFPPAWKTWGDIPKEEARRLTRNWRRWRRRRLDAALRARADDAP